MQQAPPPYVIPAVDVLGGEAVRLLRGNYEAVAVRAGDPFELVRRWAAERPELIHVVDLDAARSGRLDVHLVSGVVAAAGGVPVQFGGGVRTPADARAVLEAGAARVIVGTAALESASALRSYVDTAGDALVVAVDVDLAVVAAAGWTKHAGLSLDEALARCRSARVPRLLCTAIDRDGTLAGPNIPLLRRVVDGSDAPVLAAGGVRAAADLDALGETGVEAAVVGRSLLAGLLPLTSLRTQVGPVS